MCFVFIEQYVLLPDEVVDVSSRRLGFLEAVGVVVVTFDAVPLSDARQRSASIRKSRANQKANAPHDHSSRMAAPRCAP